MVCENTSEQPLGLAEAGQVREQSIQQLQDEFKSETIITVLVTKFIKYFGYSNFTQNLYESKTRGCRNSSDAEVLVPRVHVKQMKARRLGSCISARVWLCSTDVKARYCGMYL